MRRPTPGSAPPASIRRLEEECRRGTRRPACIADCNALGYSTIKGFKHKGLRELFEDGTTGKVRQDLQERCLRRLDALHHAQSLDELKIPGFDFHALKGVKRYTIHVNGPWYITFEFKDGDAYQVDLEQYH